MQTESYFDHIARTGKTQASFARELGKSPQTLCNMLKREDLIVTCDAADRPVYVGYYQEYYGASHG
jgi:hypothetical protein